MTRLRYPIWRDGNHAISGSADGSLRIWDTRTGSNLGTVVYPASMTSLAMIRSRVITGDAAGNVLFQDIHNLQPGHPKVTPVRLWLFDKVGTHGSWSKELTALCEWCGMRFVPEANVIATIKAMTAHLSPEQAPSLALVPDAWDESALSSECPHCGGGLQFNPFIVDNQDRFNQPAKSDGLLTALEQIKPWWRFWK